MSSAPTTPPDGPRTRHEWAVDLSSRFLYLVPYAFFFQHYYASLQQDGFHLSAFLQTLSGALGCLFAVTARFSRKVDRSFWVVVLALLAGQYYVFVSFEDGARLIPAPITDAVQITGLLFTCVGKFWLNRSFGVLPANRGVVTTGPYRLIRHPIYLGYSLGEAGFLLSTFSLRNAATTFLGWGLQAIRILLEERILKQDPAYAAYARERVRFRLIPFVF